MKSLIVTLNSKYIHSSLAPWYLKAACGTGCGEVKVLEFTINDHPESVLAEIYSEKADVVGFSCYIWNISLVLRLAGNLKKINSDIRIILGGPEVSFDAERLMAGHKFIDYIVKGEGENTFRLLLEQLNGRHELEAAPEIGGLVSRNEGRVVSSGGCFMENSLDSIASPYTDEMLKLVRNKIVYFEASRGCPYNCSYCLSSTYHGVRRFSIERIKDDLTRLIESEVRQIKFVDRTFNCNRQRAGEILEYIIEIAGNAKDINFHFEAAADLFDEKLLQIIARAPAGRIQFEIGIQTTNTKALEAVARKTDIDKVFYWVRRLVDLGNVHIHTDLIAGLPFEDYNSFCNSFNNVINLHTHQLQLGFLKLLKGSRLREEAEQHGYIYRNYPPYEVLASDYMSYDELIRLKGVEELVERYYNSRRFLSSVHFIISRYFNNPFSFFYEFFKFNQKNGYLRRSMASRELYTVLKEFADTMVPQEEASQINDLLKLDFLSTDSSNNLPLGINRECSSIFKEKCFDFLKNVANIDKYLPQYKGIPAKQIYKMVHFETFKYNVLDWNHEKMVVDNCVVMFDYGGKHPVTGLFARIKVKI